MVSNDFRLFQMISNNFKWFPKFFQMISNDFKWFQMNSNEFFEFKWVQAIGVLTWRLASASHSDCILLMFCSIFTSCWWCFRSLHLFWCLHLDLLSVLVVQIAWAQTLEQAAKYDLWGGGNKGKNLGSLPSVIEVSWSTRHDRQWTGAGGLAQPPSADSRKKLTSCCRRQMTC